MKKRHIVIVIILLLVTNVLTAIIVGQVLTGDVAFKIKSESLKALVQKHYLREVSEEDFKVGELKGIVDSLEDPYSEYLTEEEYSLLLEQTSGKFYGIGVQVAPGEDNLITVISPIKDTPADKAGIKTGDKIIGVNDKEYTALELQEAITNIKGEKGTKVKLKILKREGSIETVEVERDEIKVDTIISDVLEGQIGYIGIIEFDEGTGEDFVNTLKNQMDEGIQGLIIDVRGNPGGIVKEVVKVCDVLLPEGNIVSAKNRSGKNVFSFDSDPEGIDIPIVVLINEGSASASEILAAAIKDHNRGELIGKQTYGKGVVQSVIPFPGGDGIKLTTSEYFTPNGVNIDGEGIKPTIEVTLPEDITGIGLEHKEEDTQLQKAIELLIK